MEGWKESRQYSCLMYIAHVLLLYQGAWKTGLLKRQLDFLGQLLILSY